MIQSRAIVTFFCYIRLKTGLKKNLKDWRLVGAKKKFHEYGGRENKKRNPVMKNSG